MTDTLTSKLFANEESLIGSVHQAATCTAVVCALRGPDRKDDDLNQDSAAVFQIGDDAAVLAVADGAGGLRSGARASKIAIESIRKSLRNGLQEELVLRSAIIDAFEQANQSVLELGVGAATTLAVVEVQGNVIRPYHVGDSTILVVGQRSKVKMNVVAHSPVGYAVESGLVDEKKAMHHEDRHIVSNLIGSSDMHIEVGPTLRLARRDTVVIASDGLSDNLYTDEIVEWTRKGPMERAVKKLAEQTMTRMTKPVEGKPSKPDDVTFIICRLNA